MNDRIEQLLNENTVECMGVNQLNPRLFAQAIIRECSKYVADSNLVGIPRENIPSGMLEYFNIK